MEIEWKAEEIAAARKVKSRDGLGGIISDEGLCTVMDCGVSLFLDRASGQVAEDAKALELTIDHACEDAAWEAKYSSTDRAALSRLQALAQETTDLRERLSRQSTRAREYLDETERLKEEIHRLVREKGEVAREAESLRAKVAELETSRAYAQDVAGSLKTALDARTLEIDGCRQRVEIREKERDALRAEVERLTPLARDTEESRRATAKAWAEVERLKAENAECRRGVEEIRGHVAKAETQARLDRERAGSALEALGAQNAEVGRLKAELETTQGFHRSAVKFAKEMRQRAEAAESRLASVRAAWKQNPWQPLGTMSSVLENGATNPSTVSNGPGGTLDPTDGLPEPKSGVTMRVVAGGAAQEDIQRLAGGRSICAHDAGFAMRDGLAYCSRCGGVMPEQPLSIRSTQEAWVAMHPNGSCTCAGEGTCSWCDKTPQACENCARLQQRHDFLANEIAKMGPIAKDLLVAQARVTELEEQLTTTQKERDASNERADLWFTELVALRKEKAEAIEIAGNASPSSDLRGVMRQKQDAITDLSSSVASWQQETAKYRKRAAKWKRRAQKAALDFYEGFLIGHKIGQAIRKRADDPKPE